MCARSATLNDGHTCHAHGCTRKVKPAVFMCYPHWKLVPPEIQAAIWKNFRPGQEKDKRPSEGYQHAAKRAIDAVRDTEEQESAAAARSDLRQGGLL